MAPYNTMKTEILLLLSMLVYANTLSAEMPQPIQIMPNVTWKQYHLIEIAMKEAKKNKINVTGHQIIVSEYEKTFTVDFINTNSPPPSPLPDKTKKSVVIQWGARSNVFQVEINKTDLKIIQTRKLLKTNKPMSGKAAF